ncbi:glutathione S-transferase [Rhodanobacter sp. TND4EL1]
MTLKLYAHPFSSYCQKVLIALYENGTAFEWCLVAPDHPAAGEELAALWPLKRMPLLLDGAHAVFESSIVIEYLDQHHPGQIQLIPADADAALDARMLDRFIDNYIHTPLQKMVFDRLRPEADRDSFGIGEARAMLDAAYAWLDQRMAGHDWGVADTFSLADCAAAPALFYADWAHPIPESLGHLNAYRQRLLARPSFARAVEEARPYRSYFPLGAPDRD